MSDLNFNIKNEYNNELYEKIKTFKELVKKDVKLLFESLNNNAEDDEILQSEINSVTNELINFQLEFFNYFLEKLIKFKTIEDFLQYIFNSEINFELFLIFLTSVDTDFFRIISIKFGTDGLRKFTKFFNKKENTNYILKKFSNSLSFYFENKESTIFSNLFLESFLKIFIYKKNIEEYIKSLTNIDQFVSNPTVINYLKVFYNLYALKYLTKFNKHAEYLEGSIFSCFYNKLQQNNLFLEGENDFLPLKNILSNKEEFDYISQFLEKFFNIDLKKILIESSLVIKLIDIFGQNYHNKLKIRNVYPNIIIKLENKKGNINYLEFKRYNKNKLHEIFKIESSLDEYDKLLIDILKENGRDINYFENKIRYSLKIHPYLKNTSIKLLEDFLNYKNNIKELQKRTLYYLLKDITLIKINEYLLYTLKLFYDRYHLEEIIATLYDSDELEEVLNDIEIKNNLKEYFNFIAEEIIPQTHFYITLEEYIYTLKLISGYSDNPEELLNDQEKVKYSNILKNIHKFKKELINDINKFLTETIEKYEKDIEFNFLDDLLLKYANLLIKYSFS